jgi:hypothetical protein
MFFDFTLSPNLKHFCYHINEIGIKLVKSEKSSPHAKDVYILSSDATFDINKECANVGVVIRRGILLKNIFLIHTIQYYTTLCTYNSIYFE